MDGFNKTHQNSTQCQLRAQQIPNEAELSSVRILIALTLVLMKNKIAFFLYIKMQIALTLKNKTCAKENLRKKNAWGC